MPPVRGWKRSRALWDHARRPELERKERMQHYGRAILYELQPIRFSQVDFHTWYATILSFVRYLRKFATTTIPFILSSAYSLVKKSTLRQKGMVLVAVAYYYFIRWVHHALSAGPFVLMISALFAIFTIGLGDTADGGLSAYSVFNRGFQRLLGSVDTDALLAQHVAGGGMMMMAMNQQQQQQNNNDEGNHRDRQQDGEPRRRAQQQQQQGPAEQPEDAPAVAPPRRSGKKARRRNQEQRQELRRQREAAAAMGFGGDEQADAMAMQRLVEDQVAVNNGDEAE